MHAEFALFLLVVAAGCVAFVVGVVYLSAQFLFGVWRGCARLMGFCVRSPQNRSRRAVAAGQACTRCGKVERRPARFCGRCGERFAS